MKYSLIRTKVFERDVRKYLAHGGNGDLLGAALYALESGRVLPPWLRDHQLQGKLRQYRELHVENDWLLMYEKDGQKLIITCLWLVSHKKLRERERSI